MIQQIKSGERGAWHAQIPGWGSYESSFHDVLALSDKWLALRSSVATLPDDIFKISQYSRERFKQQHQYGGVTRHSDLDLFFWTSSSCLIADYELAATKLSQPIEVDDSLDFCWLDLSGRSIISKIPDKYSELLLGRDVADEVFAASYLLGDALYVLNRHGIQVISQSSRLHFDWIGCFANFVDKFTKAGRDWIGAGVRWVTLICSRAVRASKMSALAIEHIFHSRLLQPRIFNTFA